VFGAALSGETQGEIAVPLGNTLAADPNRARPTQIPTAPPSRGLPAPAGAAPGFAPADEGEIASAPEVAEEVTAPYPPEAQALQIEGTIPVRVEINADGTVHGARALKSLGHGLEQAAVQAVRRFRFRPGRDRAGRAVPCVIVWRYTFQIQR
jgi:protein TonB